MSSEKTFKKLKQIPLEDMIIKLDGITRPPPIYFLGSKEFTRNDYYSDLQFYFQRIRTLEENGWTVEEFLLTLEKRSIVAQIDEYNRQFPFPAELLERARIFFPNLHFEPAKINLE